MKNNKMRRKIAESIDVQGEFLTDSVMMRICGTRELILENYKGILEYNDKKIHVKTKPDNVMIMGNFLEIKMITDEILCISGEISGVSFMREDER